MLLYYAFNLHLLINAVFTGCHSYLPNAPILDSGYLNESVNIITYLLHCGMHESLYPHLPQVLNQEYNNREPNQNNDDVPIDGHELHNQSIYGNPEVGAHKRSKEYRDE
jgi:hypothetical protein